MFKKRLVALLCGAVVVSGLAVGCGSGDDEKGGTSKITVSGSTSVGPTMEVLAQAYEKNNDVKIEVQQVGSSAGIKNTIEGTSDLGMSSRDLKDEEAQSVDGTQIAIDGIAVVTHKDKIEVEPNTSYPDKHHTAKPLKNTATHNNATSIFLNILIISFHKT